MSQDPAWDRTIVRARGRNAGPLAGICFVAAMAAAFWLGALWASQSWWPALR